MDFAHNPYRCGPVRVGMYADMVPKESGFNQSETASGKCTRLV